MQALGLDRSAIIAREHAVGVETIRWTSGDNETAETLAAKMRKMMSSPKGFRLTADYDIESDISRYMVTFWK